MSKKKPSGKQEKKPRRIPGKNIGSDSKAVMAYPIKAYQISVEIYKGKKEVLEGKYGTTPFFVHFKNGAYIPFQREGDARKPIQPVKTVSIPQMIENEKVSETIQKRIDEELTKRLEHHAQQALKG